MYSIKTTTIYCSTSLGDVTSVDVRLDGADGWLLTSLQVIDWANKKAVKFEYGFWFDSGNDAEAGSVASATLHNSTLGLHN